MNLPCSNCGGVGFHYSLCHHSTTGPFSVPTNAAQPPNLPAVPPHQLGWRCPSCGRGNAPWLATCPCGPATFIASGSGTTPNDAAIGAAPLPNTQQENPES